MPDRTTTLRLLRHSAHDLVREVGLMPAAGHLWRPAEAEWSLHECLTHLRVVEREVFLLRVRRTATEARPSFEIFDEVTYQKEHWKPDESVDALLGGFVQARAEMVNILAAADWSRLGVHATRGPISLEWQADYALGHTWEHMSQIMRVRLNYELNARG